MKTKSYPVEFKIKAVEMFRGSGKSQEMIAKELGIADSTMSKWNRQYDTGVFNNSGAKVQTSSDKEIASPYRSHDSVSRWPSVGEIWTKKRRRYRDIASIFRSKIACNWPPQ